MKSDKIFDENVVLKPWGNEYVILRNKKLCITQLRITPKSSTSLHCHVKKKTGFIVLEGKASIQLGLYKSTSEILTAPSKIMIRPGLFHKITSVGKKDLIAIEIEAPSDKYDLIRFEDKYGRSKKNYETKNLLNKKKFIYKIDKINTNRDKTYKYSESTLKVKVFKNFKNLKNYSDKTIYALIRGKIINNLNKSVLPIGDIVRRGTLLKLSKKFKIKNNTTFLVVTK